MPYSIENPPEKIRDMPKHAQEIFVAAFNSALEQYKDEGKANATAYAAVKTKFKQDDKGNWIAKESNMKEAMSADDKRYLLQSALEIKFPSPNEVARPSGSWLADIFDTEIVYRKDNIDYKAPYVIDSEGKVTIGEPVKVKKQTVYTPIESLQAKYAEIIQEQARRNISAGAERVKKVLELCNEFLTSEDEGKVKEILIEAESVLTWLKTQEIMKTEGDVQFPASAFAYTPDNPSEWKLRLWENPTDKVTRKQLGAAAAALSPGGFRGQRVEIAKESLPAVKRKIRSEYRKLNVEDEDIPRWVKESESRHLLSNYTPLAEADISKGIARVIVIKPGFGNPVDNHYYPSETLSRDYAVFEGVKMYADHQTEQEEKQRPEGSIRQWVASLKNVRFEEGVGIVGDAVIIEPWLQQKLATLRDQKLLSEMGISIRAAGAGTKGKIDGKDTNIVERITRVRSVDFVTEAGAGGGVLLYETEKEFDIDIVTIEALKERRPDLVKVIENDIREKTLKEVKRMSELEDKVKELEGDKVTLTTERDEARTKLCEAEKAQRKAEAKSKIDEAISKSELPEVSKQKLTEGFKDSESADGITEAIKKETDYVNALKEASKPKNLGPTNPDPMKSKKELKEAFMRIGMSEKDAEIAVKGR